MPEAKPYVISKQVVWEAYLKVKANHGAAGVDGQSIEAFESDLKGNLYKLWNRMSSGMSVSIKEGTTLGAQWVPAERLRGELIAGGGEGIGRRANEPSTGRDPQPGSVTGSLPIRYHYRARLADQPTKTLDEGCRTEGTLPRWSEVISRCVLKPPVVGATMAVQLLHDLEAPNGHPSLGIFELRARPRLVVRRIKPEGQECVVEVPPERYVLGQFR
jgi:hypothetical protein